MSARNQQEKARCPWARSEAELAYHDEEWGVPLHDDHRLFEFLTLEGAQAGLSWSTILAKRAGYRRAFCDFDPARIVRFNAACCARLRQDPAIVRNRLKIESTVANARAVLAAQEEYGSFAAFLWDFVDGRPIHNRWRTMRQVPATTELARNMSRTLKKRGFRFFGPTICYAFMQATGMVNDHLVDCFRHSEVGSQHSG